MNREKNRIQNRTEWQSGGEQFKAITISNGYACVTRDLNYALKYISPRFFNATCENVFLKIGDFWTIFVICYSKSN